MRRVSRRSGLFCLLPMFFLTVNFQNVAAAPDEGSGSGTGDVFADLVVALRDPDGVPLLRRFETPSDVDPSLNVEVFCVQPVSTTAIPAVSPVENPADGRQVWPIPLMGDPSAPPPAEGEVVTVCDPQPAYAMYVQEAELERLNMARQPDDVKARKLNDVMIKLLTADEITLDGAGRITVDGVPIDASPEHAAIYASLMSSGSIPGLDAAPAAVGPLDAWMLAAVSLGAASGKSTPITIDSVEYYNRIVGVPAEYAEVPGVWSVDFLRTTPPGGEQFVDYSAFSYTRSEVFQGCVTWLDVPSLTWQVSPIAELANFSELPPVAVNGTVGNVAGFAQLADDVRSVIVLLHENEVVPGFFIDPVGQNTCAEQTAALTQPAVNWGNVPTDLIQTDVASITTSWFMPWAGTTVDSAQLRVKVDALDAFADGTQVSFMATDLSGQVDFAVDGNGDLVGTWGGADGFAVTPGSQLDTVFDVSVADGAPLGPYAMTLELIDLDALDPSVEVLASDLASTIVHDAALTVLWTQMLEYAEQGTYQPITARVFNPDLGQAELTGTSLRVTVDAPEAFLLDTQVSAWSETVPMSFTLDVDGNLVGTWALPDPLTVPFDQLITWYLNIAAGAPTGIYQVSIEVIDGDGAALSGSAIGEFIIVAPPVHGGGGGGGGTGEEPALPPVVSILESPPVVTNSTTATFVFEADQPTAEFGCSLDGATATLCTSPITYTGLSDGSHLFAVYATTDQVGPTAVVEWIVDTVAPVISLTDVPDAATIATDADFVFTVAGAVTTMCSLDGAALSVCASPVGYTDLDLGEHSFVVAAVDNAGNYASVSHRWTIYHSLDELDWIVPVTPVRLADTRAGWVAADLEFTGTGPVAGGTWVRVQVAGRGGVPIDADAVMMNLTIAGATGTGYATAYACGARPSTSNINYVAGRNIANQLMVDLSLAGGVCVYVSTTAEVIVDVVGYAPASVEYVTLTPVRLADTRNGFVAADGEFTGTGAVTGGQVVEVQIAGRGGVPADADSVMMNLTIAGPTGKGYATAYACGTRPSTSSINYMAGLNIANELMVDLSADGTVCVYVQTTAHVIIDVVGYAPAGSSYLTVTPVRLADTRAGWVAADGEFTGTGPIAGGQLLEVQIAGRGGVPSDADAVMINLTIAGATGKGYATVFGCGVQPPTSSINYVAGQNIANELMAGLSADGRVCIYVHTTAQVIIDVVGYW